MTEPGEAAPLSGQVRKRSVSIKGHRTSFSLEDIFHDELHRIAHEEGASLAALIARIDEDRPADASLSSALRVYVVRRLRDQLPNRSDPSSS